MARPSILVRSRALTGFAQLVIKLGGQPTELLVSAGLSHELLDNANLSLPLQSFADLLDRAAKDLGQADFGARLAGYQDVSVLGPVALLARHASTVEDALQSIERYMPYHSPGLHMSLVRDSDRALLHLFHDASVSGSGRQQLTELTYAGTLTFLRMITQSKGSDWQLHFQYSSGLSAARYRKMFGCRVQLNQLEDVLIFPEKVLHSSLESGSAELRSAAERSVRHLIRRHRLDLARQIEVLAERQLAAGACTLSDIAALLGMPKHELQRRLAAQGYKFEDIIDNRRRALAEEFLPHTEIPLTEIAYLLGYGDPSSLTRSCRRWFGESPRVMRGQHLGAAHT
jgi:AraC-like DNA-binding protein